MVKDRPVSINNGTKSRYMLEPSKALNTIKKPSFSQNVKDVTMNNKQETKTRSLFFFKSLAHGGQGLSMLVGSSEAIREKYFPLKILRYGPHFCNNLLRRTLSTQAGSKNLDPWWVTGFSDAEGCFSVIVEILGPSKWRVRVSFEINLHEKDENILKQIQSFFKVGGVYNRKDRKLSVFRVSNVQFLKDIIIPHFSQYPLLSQKQADFLLWSKVVLMIIDKTHLTTTGFLSILSIYSSINRGVSLKVATRYPNIKPVIRPRVSLPAQLNPNWVSGFLAGDGGFSINIRPSPTALGKQVGCRFHIAQHSRDIELMRLFITFFGCGTVYSRQNTATPRCDFVVQDFPSLWDKILPHLDRYPLHNLKQEDYFCFKQCMLLIKANQHLTPEGLKRIQILNLEMNLNRLK